MTSRERLSKAVEEIISALINSNFEKKEVKIRKANPVRVKIGDKEFVSHSGQTVFLNKQEAFRAIEQTLKKTTFTIKYCDGYQGKVFGVEGAFLKYFGDLNFSSGDKWKVVKSLRPLYQAKISFDKATIEEYLLENFGLTL